MEQHYLMENEDESYRLELKTDMAKVQRQAIWAGMKPGMNVLDLGCGPGKISALFHEIVQPKGHVVGVDGSMDRITHAKAHYGKKGVEFIRKDITEHVDGIGNLDFIWVRFFLEYHRANAFEIVKGVSEKLNPGGIICLVDLDCNCLNHYGIPERLDKAIRKIMGRLEKNENFDPYMGKKLYSFLYDLNFQEIDVMMEPHHLIYGELSDIDAFNWTKKVEVVGQRSNIAFEGYKGGYQEFYDEFKKAFADPRRFTYTPVICCRGVKPRS